MKLQRMEEAVGVLDHARDNFEHARWVFGVAAIIVFPLVALKIGGWVLDWMDRLDGPQSEPGGPVDYPLDPWQGGDFWL
jgi:hypothetical protein